MIRRASYCPRDELYAAGGILSGGPMMQPSIKGEKAFSSAGARA